MDVQYTTSLSLFPNTQSVYSLHDATKVDDIPISHLQLKVKGSTDSRTARHTSKVDRYNSLELDVDCRLKSTISASIYTGAVIPGQPLLQAC